MQENNYQRIEDQSNNEIKEALLTALTAKFQDYMFDPQKQQLASSKKYKRPAFTVDDMQNSFIDMKRSFQYVGDNSQFQKTITFILVLQWVAFSYMVNSMAFLFRSPEFTCKVPLTDFWIPCHANQACKFIDTGFVKVNFENSNQLNFYQVSITQTFWLVCQKVSWAPYAQSLFFLGGFLSGYLFSYLSSKLGKRSVLIIILCMVISSILICAFAINFTMFLIGYFFIGFSFFGYETSIYIYIGQISGPRFRTISVNMLTMVWAGTPLFLPILSLLPSWKYTFLLFAGVLIATIPFSYNYFLESPRFLASQKCYTQARKIFQKISITNNRPPYNFNLIQEMQRENESYLKYGSSYQNSMALVQGIIGIRSIIRQYNFLDLFKYSSLKKITFVLMYWWMFRFFMYFGLNLALQSILHSGLLLTLVIAFAALIQVLGTFGITLMTTILYRKNKLDIMKNCLLITTTCCVIMWFLKIKIQCKNLTGQNYQVCIQLILMIILVVLIKFFNTVFFSGLITYYSEVFPTPVRSIGCGFTITFGRLGTIMVPFYINYMKEKYDQKNSLSFLAPFGLIAFLLCFKMPYTQQGLRQRIQQQEHREQTIQMV